MPLDMKVSVLPLIKRHFNQRDRGNFRWHGLHELMFFREFGWELIVAVNKRD